jgi:hypothetical protein
MALVQFYLVVVCGFEKDMVILQNIRIEIDQGEVESRAGVSSPTCKRPSVQPKRNCTPDLPRRET